MSKFNFPHIVIVKSPGLLPMEYSPNELAQELAIAKSTLRDWIRVGVPHRRDESGRIWIVGTEFNHWVQEQRKAR